MNEACIYTFDLLKSVLTFAVATDHWPATPKPRRRRVTRSPRRSETDAGLRHAVAVRMERMG